MLVLTRKQNEKIRIGDSITITVLRMKGKAVRLGIEAPNEVGVMRGELIFDLESDASANEQSTVEQAAAETKQKSPRSSAASTMRENRWPIDRESANSALRSAPLRAMLKK